MKTDAEIAERLTRRRSRSFAVLAILFISQQAVYFSDSPDGTIARFKFGAWLFLTIIMLVLLATGGNLLRSPAVRALMNDETTQAHRAKAVSLGFWNSMATGVLLYMLTVVKAFDPRDAIHVMMTVGIASALLSFAMMERRALA